MPCCSSAACRGPCPLNPAAACGCTSAGGCAPPCRTAVRSESRRCSPALSEPGASGAAANWAGAVVPTGPASSPPSPPAKVAASERNRSLLALGPGPPAAASPPAAAPTCPWAGGLAGPSGSTGGSCGGVGAPAACSLSGRLPRGAGRGASQRVPNATCGLERLLLGEAAGWTAAGILPAACWRAPLRPPALAAGGSG